jgi:lipopolysaccharide transport system permease protein
MPEYAWLVKYNPLAYIESIRYMLNVGDHFLSRISLVALLSNLFLVGVLFFNKTEKFLLIQFKKV